MNKQLRNSLILSIAGNVGMIVVRVIYTYDLYYVFLLWNLFLAAVPLLISDRIYRRHRNYGMGIYVLLLLWLLFLPNAPYIITDLVHLYHRPPVPYWFDMCLVLLSAFNGLVLGFVSIGQIEKTIQYYKLGRYMNVMRLLTFLAMSYGVYLGRYLRFNSWDAFIRPVQVARGAFSSINLHTLGFVLTFTFVTYVLYSFYQAILLRRVPKVS
jgi:uncharacterized membrane protein